MFSKYHELGLVVIPILPKSKAPVADARGFDDWSVNGQSRSTIDMFEEKYPIERGYGIAVVCGPASNVSVIDIDTLDSGVVASCPLSPVIRRGRNGRFGAIFMRYNPDVSNESFKRQISPTEELRVDVLCLKKYIIIPPSIHETGIKYQWVTPDTLENFSIKELPLLTNDHKERISQAVGVSFSDTRGGSSVDLKGTFHSPDGIRCPHGSHDRIKALTAALISRGVSIDEAVYELLSYDADHHIGVRFFSDPRTGSDFGADAVSNATRFFACMLKTINQNHIKRGEPIEVPLGLGQHPGSVSIELGSIPQPKAFVPMELPEPSGFLKDVYSYVLSGSKRKQKVIALSTAFSLGSVLLANRVKCGSVWTNTQSLLIAPTGAGKGFAGDAITRFLAIDNETSLLGYSDYLSSQAFLKKLDVYRERLDIVDECARLFGRINSGGSFQADILQCMMDVYSKSHSLYICPESKGSDKVSVFHPCVSVLAMTNPEGFLTTVTKTYITSGFLPRFFLFIEHDYAEDNPSFESWDESLASRISTVIQEMITSFPILMDPPGTKRNFLVPRPYPRETAIAPAAEKLIRDYDKKIDAEVKSSDVPDTIKSFHIRVGQQVKKAALIHGRFNTGAIEVSDAQWAIDLYDALFYNAKPLLSLATARNPIEAATIGILEVVRKTGKLSQAKLFEQTRHLSKTQRAESIETLIIEGKIRQVMDQNSKVYILT